MTIADHTPRAVRIQWAGLAGRESGAKTTGRPSFVFLHGLTFDRRMWDPVLEALPDNHRAIAFDLPGHGGSPALPDQGLAPVVEAIHDAVVAAALDSPVMVGHSIGGPLAAIYAASHPAAGVVSVDAPIRLEPFAELLQHIGPQLSGAGFGQVWETLRAGLHMELLTDEQRELLRSGDHPSQEVFLSYQHDLLARPLEDVVRWRDEGLERLRRAGTPYVALQANPVDEVDRTFLAERLPQAELVVWPVGHHFPHLSEPVRFAALLTGLAAGVEAKRAA